LAKYLDAPAAIGRQKTTCDENGDYSRVQYGGSTGYSWCVDPDTGVKVEGSDARPGSTPTCGHGRGKRALGGPCTAATGALKPGEFRSQCTTKGYYSLIQRHGSTGYKWCVNPTTGVKVEGTEAGPGKEATCPTCVTILSKALSNLLIGAEIPQCAADGRYSRIQMSGSTGFAWCVDQDTGKKTSKLNKFDEVKCDDYKIADLAEGEPQGPCAAQEQSPLIGSYRPKCDGRGYYASIQTREGHRFCVDTNTGIQLPGSPTFAPGDNRKLPCEN